MKYRPELDGIRAIAVIAVILFHIDSSWLPGGFLGVDVFFVLSGFLITTILLEQAERRIPLKQFWVKRIRRIIPPLVGMVAFTLILGSAFFLRVDRNLLLEHSATALVSISNFFIWDQTNGYWGISTASLPLLHTWSLSVEEQFYFFFPLILSLLYKRSRRLVVPSLVVLTLCSFCSAWLYDDIDPSAVFLMLPFRSWQLLMGALLAITMKSREQRMRPSKGLHSALQFLALALLGYTIVTTDVGYLYVGTVPLMACLATTTLIYSFHCATFFKKTLSHPLFVYVGKRSYSLYLYHWPIIVFTKLYTPQPNVWLILCISFVCAELSYQYIEKPFRYQPHPFRKVRNWAMSLTLPLGFAAVALSHHPYLVTSDLYSLSLPNVNDRGDKFDMPDIKEGSITNAPSWNWNPTERPQVLLAGSSHASSMVFGLAEFCQKNNLSFVALARSFKGIVGETPTNKARLEFARQHTPLTIVLFSHWKREVEEHGIDSYKEAIAQWSQLCDYLIVVDSPPQINIPPKMAPSLHHYLVHLDLTGRPLEVDVIYRDASPLKAFIETLPNAQWIDLGTLFTEENKCRVLPNGDFPYADTFHLNILGIRFLLEQELGKQLLLLHK